MFIISEIVGAFDLLTIAVFRDMKEIKRIVNAVKSLPCVEKVEIALSDESFYPFREEYAEMNLFKL